MEVNSKVVVMADKQFVMSLAKFVIAVAWADGNMTDEEVYALKDLLFTLPDLSVESGDEWVQLGMYMDTPVGQDERERLMSELLDKITSPADKDMVMRTLRGLVKSDGEISEEEESVLADLDRALDSKSTGLLGIISKAVNNAIGKRVHRVALGPNREERIDDYIHNAVYYHLVSDFERQGIGIDISDEQIRKLCLAAGLMARIAWVDEEISEDEKKAMSDALIKHWDLDRHLAELVCEISVSRTVKGLDYVRLTRSFYECTTVEERVEFLSILFQIANSCSKTSHDEIEGIRKIATSLHLSHDVFIDAKLTVSREDRKGL